jgi:hypothetical protein
MSDERQRRKWVLADVHDPQALAAPRIVLNRPRAGIALRSFHDGHGRSEIPRQQRARRLASARMRRDEQDAALVGEGVAQVRLARDDSV